MSRPEDVIREALPPTDETAMYVAHVKPSEVHAALDELVRERDAAYAEADRLIGERLTIERERDEAEREEGRKS